MAGIAAKLEDNQDSKDFAKLLDESLGEITNFEGQVVTGTVVSLTSDSALVDVGLKAEGLVPLKEFGIAGAEKGVNIGDQVDVYVERLENREGQAVLSREKARREEAWEDLEKSYNAGEQVEGVIFARVKGGFTVDLSGAIAFLPGSQVDIRPVKDASPLIGETQPFMILKMDRLRGNIVVSRRAIMEESRQEVRADLMKNMAEGQKLDGIVKNITDYGAFVDLGGIDGLLHVTDMSWKRINHPSELLEVGQTIQVMVTKFDEKSQRVSLGMKQLEKDPWDNVGGKFASGSKVKGTVTNIADYGAFVDLGEGIEGLIHVSEMSWTKKNLHPSKVVSTDEEVEVVVLDVDNDKRRISLGLKQAQENPWTDFAAKFKEGDEIEGTIQNKAEFGMFISVPGGIDGMVHLSDISWEDETTEVMDAYKEGDTVKVKVLEIDPQAEKISLGIKQLTEDPFASALEGISKGDVVTCTVTATTANAVEVSVHDVVKGVIKRSDLSRERSEQRPDRFAVGEKVDAKVVKVEPKNRSLMLSIKAKELDEEKAAMKEFGSTESGASLGDILGAALQEKEGKAADTKEEKPAKKTAKKEEKEEK
ncbi:MAG: 30S ribosomal protein S1 [Micavibrio sp.]|nr:30S ribosomal protein S1 [Micavibrio sp.]HCK32997.1 30S ribosomal protein S1 [Rhodospirillaceae bacterium]|tara:strand:+ start:941 stop:2716 length:1776 start_codon:yes stop_codon:yes gene_type:complete